MLGVVAGCLQREAAARAEAFNGRPYFRVLLGLICELAPAEPGAPEELPAMKMLAAIAVTLEGVQPVKVPGFAFQWLELISHRFAPPTLASCTLPPAGLKLTQLVDGVQLVEVPSFAFQWLELISHRYAPRMPPLSALPSAGFDVCPAERSTLSVHIITNKSEQRSTT